MEDNSSGNTPVLLSALRSLARRGAKLRRQPDGSGTIENVLRPVPAQAISPIAIENMQSYGWLRSSADDGSLIISRRGASFLRTALSRPGRASPIRRGAPGRPGMALPAPDKPRLNDKESPLAWLRKRSDKDGKPLIGEIEFLAGEQLRLDFERAQLGPRVTASWDAAATTGSGPRGAPGTGLEMAEAVVAARQRIDRAMKTVGPELAGLLLDVCCFLRGLEDAERNRGWPRRSGKVVLQLALAHLARHYGFDRAVRAGSGRIRSWGASDYRPSVDGDEAA